MTKRKKNGAGKKNQLNANAEELLKQEIRGRHIGEQAVGEVASRAPAAAALLGPHPRDAEALDATGSPSADIEREQAEEHEGDPDSKIERGA
jgi:hypothetical protein